MPNPADSYRQTVGHIHTVRNNKSTGKLDDQLRMVLSHRLVDALITTVHPDYEAKYTVDIYEQGFDNPPTRQSIQALTCDPREVYDLWFPAKGIFFLDRFFIVSGLHMFFLKVSAPPDVGQPNRVRGWPAGFNGLVDASITNEISVNFVHSNTLPVAGVGYNTDTKFAWMRFPEPYQIEGDGAYTSAGVIILGSGAKGIKYGKLKTAWPGGTNDITLKPSDAAGTLLLDEHGDPMPDVTVKIQLPIPSVPPFMAADVDDVLAYFDEVTPFLCSVPLPIGQLNEVFQMITALKGGVAPLKAL